MNLTEQDLHEYQKLAYRFMRDNPYCAIFLDTGLGKTATVLFYIWRLLFESGLDGENHKILIVAPKRVANVTWPDEFKIWEFSRGLRFNLIRDEATVDFINSAGTYARREGKLNGLSGDQLKSHVEKARLVASQIIVRRQFNTNRCPVHIIGYHMIDSLVDAWGRDWPYDTVILDESSAFKDHSTNRWKALWKVRRLKVMKRMVQLTATPCAESYLHLFAQINLLDCGERFGKSYNTFANRYANLNQYTRKWTLREGSEDAIANKVSDVCLIMKQEDYLDLEKPVFVQRKIHLAPHVFEKYLQMERDQVVELSAENFVVAETAAAVHSKLLQMASGVVYETKLICDDEHE